MAAMRILSILCLCILHTTTHIRARVPYFFSYQQLPQIVIPYNFEQKYASPIEETTNYYRQPENNFFTSLPGQQIYQIQEYIHVTNNPQQNDLHVDDNLKKITHAPMEIQEDKQLNEQFVGYAYRNEHNDGGRSNVIYFTGLNVDHLRAVNTFMRTGNLNNTTDLARTAASNSVDAHAKYEFDIPSNDSPAFQSLDNPNSFLRTFYSLHHNLISRSGSDYNVEGRITKTENPVVPVVLTRSSILEDIANNTSAINESTTTDTNETTKAIEDDVEETTNSDAEIIVSVQNSTSQSHEDLKLSSVDQTTAENVTVENILSQKNISTSDNVTNTII